MKLKSHPFRHLVGVLLSVVVVEDQDGGDDAGGHHEHDAVEVGACELHIIALTRIRLG